MNRYRKYTKILALLLAAVLVLGLMPGRAEAASSSELKEQLEELEEQKKELQAQMQEIQGQYQANENEILDMVSQKNVIDQEIALLHAQVKNINEQISAYSLLIADKQEELDAAQARLDELSEKNRERIRAMEEQGEISYWLIIFEANSFFDLLDRINMVEEIEAADQRRLAEMSAVAEEIAQAQTQLEEEKTALEAVILELEAAQVLLDEKRTEADAILTELVAKGEEYLLLLEKAEEEEDALMQEIANMEDEYEEAKYQEWLATSIPTYSDDHSTNIPASSGWMQPLPAGSYRVSSTFGMRLHPVLGYYRMHNGVDFGCPQGTPIYASRSGQVTIATYSGSAGYYVSINHGDGWSSVYMHMTNYIVSAGQYVTQGQVIGYVGSTGYSTGPHLHFGISYNGTYVNPMNYL